MSLMQWLLSPLGVLHFPEELFPPRLPFDFPGGGRTIIHPLAQFNRSGHMSSGDLADKTPWDYAVFSVVANLPLISGCEEY